MTFDVRFKSKIVASNWIEYTLIANCHNMGRVSKPFLLEKTSQVLIPECLGFFKDQRTKLQGKYKLVENAIKFHPMLPCN